MVRRTRALLGIFSLVVGVVALPVVVRPADAAEAPSTVDGLIAFSIGVQVPPFREDLAVPSDVWTVRPDGTGLRRLTHVPAGKTAALPAWSPRGGSIVFETNVNGDYELWSMGARGANKHRLTGEAGYDHLTPSWSPDGRKIVFSRCHKPFGFVASCSIATVNADGTGLRVILDGKRVHSKPVFSPNGRTIAFQSDRAGLVSAIWLIDVDGTNLRRLTAPGTLAYWPDFTPDSRNILYSSNCCLPHSDVYAVPVGGGPARKLTNAPGLEDEAFAGSSPSGRSLVLWSTAEAPECCALLVQRANGSRTTLFSGVDDIILGDWGSAPLRIDPASASEVFVPPASAPATTAPARRAAPAAAPDAPRAVADPRTPGRIIFGDFIARQLFAVGGNGGPPVQLTHFDANHDPDQPDISPDGKHIVFNVFTADGSAPARTWIMNADGANPHPLGRNTPGFEPLVPKFTPDGRRIVFAQCGEVCAIWIMNADGTGKRAITPFRDSPTEHAIDFWPAVSPNGRQVAFTRFQWQGFTSRVFVVDIDGGNERAITPPWLEAGDPDYSPGGGKLVVVSQLSRLGANIWAVLPDGSSLKRLTSTQYPRADGHPAYAPDGTRVAFASDRRYDDFCCNDLFKMRTDGTQEQRIATGALDGVLSVDWGLSPPAGSPSLAPSATPRTEGGVRCPDHRGAARFSVCSATPAALAGTGLASRFRD